MEYLTREEISQRTRAGYDCVKSHGKQALTISFVPLVSAVLVQGICVKMILKLDKILGIPTAKGFDSEVYQDIFAGILMMPAMAVPILGAGVAKVHVMTIGEHYVKAVVEVLKTSTLAELADENIVHERIRAELAKIHQTRREKRK